MCCMHVRMCAYVLVCAYVCTYVPKYTCVCAYVCTVRMCVSHVQNILIAVVNVINVHLGIYVHTYVLVSIHLILFYNV